MMPVLRKGRPVRAVSGVVRSKSVRSRPSSGPRAWTRPSKERKGEKSWNEKRREGETDEMRSRIEPLRDDSMGACQDPGLCDQFSRSFILHVMPDLIRHLRSFERVEERDPV